MSVVCVAWSSHVGALMSAASRPGMPSVRVLSSRMLEEPDGVERCLETMRSATALFVFRTTDALWDQLDEGIRLIGKTVPVVCVSYDPAAWALSSVPVETAQTAYRYLTYGGAENLGNLFRQPAVTKLDRRKVDRNHQPVIAGIDPFFQLFDD